MNSEDSPVELMNLKRLDSPEAMETKHEAKMKSVSGLPPELESETQNSSQESTSVEDDDSQYDIDEETRGPTSFLAFRLNFLFVTLVVMLADGLQGVYYDYDGIDTLSISTS